MRQLLSRPWVEAVLLALPLLVLYQVLSWRHVEAELCLFNDHYFAADPHLYTAIFTETVSGPRRWMHPLLPILVGLPGRSLVAMGLDPRVVACALVQFATFLSLVVWQRILRHAGCGFVLRALGAWLFGLSFSTVIHGSLPESFAFGALALLATVYWLQKGGQPGVTAVLLAAACFGTTVTNLGAWAGMVLVARWLDGRGSVWRWGACGLAGLAVAVAAFAVYETVLGGWGRMQVDPEFEKVWWGWPADALARLGDLGAVIGTPPVLMRPLCFVPPVAFEPVMAFGKGGTALLVEVDRVVQSHWPAVLSYALLLASACRLVARDARTRQLAFLLLADLVCQLPVYFLYGDALLAYSMHWTFALCGGIVLVARRCGGLGTLALAVLVVVIGIGNVRCAFDVADAHLAYRDQSWRLERAATGGVEAGSAGVEFVALGRVGLDSGTARPFLLWPDERTVKVPDAETNPYRLPPFVLPPEQWQWLGEGTADHGEVAARGRWLAPPGAGPAWISLRLEGRWRRCRVEGFLFPRKLGP